MTAALDKRAILASALLAAVASTPAAQEKITLRLAESLPAGHVIHELVAKPFMELVTKATNGQVTFQHYPAEQLGKAKDMAQLTVAGVADVSYIVRACSRASARDRSRSTRSRTMAGSWRRRSSGRTSCARW